MFCVMVMLTSDITLDLRMGDEIYELRIAAHHSLVVQSLTKELRRLALVVRTYPLQCPGTTAETRSFLDSAKSTA